jgi:hypothetical protein
MIEGGRREIAVSNLTRLIVQRAVGQVQAGAGVQEEEGLIRFVAGARREVEARGRSRPRHNGRVGDQFRGAPRISQPPHAPVCCSGATWASEVRVTGRRISPLITVRPVLVIFTPALSRITVPAPMVNVLGSGRWWERLQHTYISHDWRRPSFFYELIASTSGQTSSQCTIPSTP